MTKGLLQMINLQDIENQYFVNRLPRITRIFTND
ncbi:MAG: hypothetical protein RLZZ628_3095 [Bacteroidota bacterium]|jgi:hypothetical protein